MQFLKKHALAIVGLLLGAAGGYAYYHFLGCQSGSCAITSQPLPSTLYGMAMGWLLLTSFRKSPPRATDSHS